MELRLRALTIGSRWWLGILLFHTVTRVALLPAYWIAWRNHAWWPDGYLGESPTWWSLISRGWDGHWYSEIAEHGYPRDLPLDPETGFAAESEWAFFPAFPFLSQAVMTATRLPWDLVAPVLVWGFGYLALCLIYLLIREGTPQLVEARPFMPFLVVIAVAVFPGSAVFGAAYSEALALALIAGYLLSLVKQRYWLGAGLIILFGFTRGITLPLVIVLVWHVILRFKGSEDAGRLRSRPRRSELVAIGANLFLIVIMSMAWPAVVGFFTGRKNAYLEIQGTWRNTQFDAIPFSSWYAQFDNPVAVTAVLAVIVASIVWWASSRRSRSLGPELQAWGGAYIGYLVAVVGLNTSLLRFLTLSILLPATIFFGAKDRSAVLLLTGVSFVLQFLLIVVFWSTPGASP